MKLEGTISAEAAAAQEWDAAVIGAGPAGSVAARQLARAGVAVLLVDKAAFPRFKVCGSCLNMRALARLQRMGLGGMPARQEAVPLKGVLLASAGVQAWAALPGGVALSREAFDAELIREAISAGARFLPETTVRLGPAGPVARRLRLHRNSSSATTSARVILAADGLCGSAFSQSTGYETARNSRIGAGVIVETAPRTYEAGTIFMACGIRGYVGLVRLEDGRLNVAAAFDPACAKRAGGLGPLAARILGEVGLPSVPRLADLPWRGTPLLTRRTSRPADERLFGLGDAAGYVEPFTGEGIAWALEAAGAVVPFALRACHGWRPDLAAGWCAWYRRTVVRRQSACRAVAYLLRRPVLTRMLVATLARAPALASPLIHHLNRQR